MKRSRHRLGCLVAVSFFVLTIFGGETVGNRATAATGQVAVLISDSGGVTLTACVAAGPTGDRILNEVTSVGYRPRDGIITQIGGYPASNAATDNTHYWAYYHDTGGGWTYSNVGASGYTPAAGTIEGWRYDNGASPVPYPPAISFPSICPGQATPPTKAALAPPTAPGPSIVSSARPATASKLDSSTSETNGAARTVQLSPTPSAVTSANKSSDETNPTNASATTLQKTTYVSRAAAAPKTSTNTSGSLKVALLAAVLISGLAGASIFISWRRRKA